MRRYIATNLIKEVFKQNTPANTNIFSSDITVPSPTPVRIIIKANASGVLTGIIKKNNDTESMQYNGSNALTANAGYIFETIFDKNKKYNFTYSVNAIITMEVWGVYS